ncbi:hypothetical protein BJX62DRAFT_179830 [Aspergillus germanicus]
MGKFRSSFPHTWCLWLSQSQTDLISVAFPALDQSTKQRSQQCRHGRHPLYISRRRIWGSETGPGGVIFTLEKPGKIIISFFLQLKDCLLFFSVGNLTLMVAGTISNGRSYRGRLKAHTESSRNEWLVVIYIARMSAEFIVKRWIQPGLSWTIPNSEYVVGNICFPWRQSALQPQLQKGLGEAVKNACQTGRE